MKRTRLIAAAVLASCAVVFSAVATTSASASDQWSPDKDKRGHYSNGDDPTCYRSIDRVVRLTVEVNKDTDAVAAAQVVLDGKKAALTVAQNVLNALLPLESPPSSAEIAAQLAVTAATAQVATAQANLDVAVRTLGDAKAHLALEITVRDRVCKVAPPPSTVTVTPPAPPAGDFSQIGNSPPVGAVDTGDGSSL